jgi:hypothetical protein
VCVLCVGGVCRGGDLCAWSAAGSGSGSARAPVPTRPRVPPSTLDQIGRVSVATSAFHDPLWTRQAELLGGVVMRAADVDVPGLAGGPGYLDTLTHKDRQWVKTLPALAPPTKPRDKPGCVQLCATDNTVCLCVTHGVTGCDCV